MTLDTVNDRGLVLLGCGKMGSAMLEGWLRQGLALGAVWAGLRPGSPDELPILGPVQGVKGYLNACGHFRTGILTSAITGVLIDKVLHEETLPLDLTPFLADRFVNAPAALA